MSLTNKHFIGITIATIMTISYLFFLAYGKVLSNSSSENEGLLVTVYVISSVNLFLEVSN